MKLAISKNSKYQNEAEIKAVISSELNNQAIALDEFTGKVYMYFKNAIIGDLKPDDNPVKGYWLLDASLVLANVLKVVPNDHDFTAENDEDVSSMIKWDEAILKGNVDYKTARKEIKNLFFAEAGMSLENWAGMSAEKKEIAARYFLVPNVFRNEIYTKDQQLVYGEKFHEEAVKCRVTRSNRALTIIRINLAPDDANEVIDDLNEIYDKVDGRKFARNLLRTYIDLGREGTSAGDPSGIYDYIEGTGGFTGKGLPDKGFTPIDMTIQELVNEVMNVFRNGIL